MTTLTQFKEDTKDLPKRPEKIKSSIGDVYQLNGNEHFDEPEVLVEGLLVLGSLTILSGEPKAGKGWVALMACKTLVENESMKVLYLDRENGPRRTSRRIRAIREDIDKWSKSFFYAFNPRMDQTDEAKENFEKFLDEIEPDITIFDSFAGFLGAMNADENSSRDVAAWSEAYLRPIRDREITALIIDHTPRGEGRSRGSMRKSEEADINLFLDPDGDFDPETTTTAYIRRLSDRDGILPKSSAYKIGGDGNGGFIFERTETHRLGLSGEKLRMLEVLEKQGGKGLKHGEWLEAAKSEGINASTARSAISNLKNHEYKGDHIVKHEDSTYYPNTLALLDTPEEREAS